MVKKPCWMFVEYPDEINEEEAVGKLLKELGKMELRRPVILYLEQLKLTVENKSVKKEGV